MSFIIKVILVSVFVLSTFYLTSAMTYLVIGKQGDGRNPIALFLGSVVSCITFYGTLGLLVYLS